MKEEKFPADGELIDVLDENGIKTGKTLTRQKVHSEGLWHRIVVVALLNNEGQILIQQRSAGKDKNPNMWDISVTGHLSAGQDSLSAACREINEELGITVDEEKLRYIFSYRREQRVSATHHDRQYYDFFVLRLPEIDVSKIKLQESEVQQVKLVSIQTLKQMISSGQVVERNETYSALFEYLAK